VAQQQRRFADAETAYRQALDLKLEFNNRHSAASTYHQLGMLAQEQRRFADAETAYRQALDLYLEFNDRHSATSTYHQLGIVAQEQRRFADALGLLLGAACMWRRETGAWPQETLTLVRSVRDETGSLNMRRHCQGMSRLIFSTTLSLRSTAQRTNP
jgi:tetratricopeptide (TPR) repeat protein